MTAKQEAIQLINSADDDDAVMLLWMLKRIIKSDKSTVQKENAHPDMRTLGGYKYNITISENFDEIPDCIKEYIQSNEIFN